MTPQEFNFIKDSFSQIIDDIAGNPDWGKAAEAVASDLGTLERLLKEKVVALPSNLDEAAQKVEDYYDVGEEHGYLCCHRGDIKDAFKAGAKWMAAQGVRQEEIVEDKALGLGCGVLPGITPIINLSGAFKPGDKVIVQIRKK